MTRNTGPPRSAGGNTNEHGTHAESETRPHREPQRYVLRLYVAGTTRRSEQAIERVRALCDDELADCYELEVIDIYQLPALARGEQIVATPTLVRVLPSPLRRFIGNLTRENVFFGLDLRAKPA